MTDSGPAQTPADARSWAPPASESSAAPTAVFARATPAAVPTRKLGWTPPPKRGLVPLRPIPTGVILGAPFRLQRRAPRTTLAPALVISLVTTTLAMLLSWGLVAGTRQALDAAYYSDYLTVSALLGVLGVAGSWVPLMLAFPATALLAGAVAVATSRAVLAERVSFRGLLWRLTGRRARLVAWTALVLLASAAVLTLATLLPLTLATSMPGVGTALAWMLAFVEGVGILVGLGPVIARLGFVSHAIALEGLTLAAAVRRSWQLTRGAGWRLFGIQLGAWVLVMLASSLLLAPIGFALDVSTGLIFPNGTTPLQAEIYDAVRTIVLGVATAAMGAFGLVLQTVTGSLLYLDTRMRTEGFDLTLARYVDERQRGIVVPDPFPSGGAATPHEPGAPA